MRIIDHPSPNHGPRPAGARVRFLILHYTGMRTVEEAFERLTTEAGGVSAHHTVLEDGTVHTHVPEDRRAWHAGVAHWDGIGDINSWSVGVEIVNPGHEWGYRPFPQAQMDAVAELSRAIIQRHAIATHDVLGHSDVAPSRKMDPGELFDWPWLAAQGVGLWPTVTDADRIDDGRSLAQVIRAMGYDPAADDRAVVTAFKRHFHPGALETSDNAQTVAQTAAIARAWTRLATAG